MRNIVYKLNVFWGLCEVFLLWENCRYNFDCLLIWDSWKLFALVRTFFFCLFLSQLNNSIKTPATSRTGPSGCCWLPILRMNLGWCWWRSQTCPTRRTWWCWNPSWWRWRRHEDLCRSHWSKDVPGLTERWSETWGRTPTFSDERNVTIDLLLTLSKLLTSSRSRAKGSISGTRSWRFLGRLLTKLFLRTGESSGQADSGGVPTTWKILASWSVSYFPGNKGDLLYSSAKMQPHDQMSTGVA